MNKGRALKLNLLVVLIFSFFGQFGNAAPTTPDIDIVEQKTHTPEVSEKPVRNSDLETLSASPVAPLKSSSAQAPEEGESYFYNHEESLALRLGLNYDFGNPPDPEDEDPSAQFGFIYMFESKGSTHVEAGFDLFPKREEFLIHAGLKFIHMYTESFRPFYRLGAALKLDSGDKFNTPIKTENYFIFGGLGFEDVISDPLSFRVDLELFYSLDNILFLVQTGLSFGF